ncbi:hypothetical protein B0T22DRAFT_461243 [Podospora appendiculata]|uniref:Uncharacterized protein n=1 Tax=Podospora appendiculata TaxID=314037 RepID=A0AAE1CD71_9PEZI|nr:hypothetical protein B0T22DRAFT_461243 [Podospora appendiculata]
MSDCRSADKSYRHHRERRRYVRTYSSRDVPAQIQPATPRILSHIHPLLLEENIGGGRGNYASTSILEPVMRIERGFNDTEHPRPRPVYRIILSFNIQFAINKSDDEYVIPSTCRSPFPQWEIEADLKNSLQRHNRIFDSINCRYLYRSGERHDLLPKGDLMASEIQLSRESGNSADATAGITATAGGQPIPAFTVHAQHASKLTYERKLRSWRKSLTYETCRFA